MKKFSIALAIAALGATGATAADLKPRPYTKAPILVAEPVANWSGFYIGGNVGYGWSEIGHQDLTTGGNFWSGGPGGAFGGRQTIKPEGIVGGGQIGFNMQSGSWVLGLEAQMNGTDLNRTNASIFFPATDSLSAKVDYYGTVAGRLGYAFSNWLPYVKGGYAGANLNTRNFDNTGDSLSNTKWRNGYVVGGGLEYAFTPNWIAGVEYNYMDFGTKSFTGINTVSLGTENFSDKLTMSTVTARLSYKFGSMGSLISAKY